MDLDLGSYHDHLKFKEENAVRYIHDPVRKSWFLIQPEEIVRQTWIQFLHHHYQVSFSSLGVEKEVKIGQKKFRYDLVYYLKGKPYILFEFKSFNQALDLDASLQIHNYNKVLQVPYLIISNGHQTLGIKVDMDNEKTTRLEAFPLTAKF